METLHQLISRYPIANGLTAQQIQLLVDCATRVSYEAGEFIFAEGESAQNCFLIESGKVALELDLGGERRQIDVIGPKDALGWAWFFPPFYWHFDARAIEPTQVISLYGKRLREECERDPVLACKLATHMTGLVINRLQKTRMQLLQTPKIPKSFSVIAPNLHLQQPP